MTFKHQGDVLFQPYAGELRGDVVTHDGSFVLARGEVHNHKHVITVADPSDMEIRRLQNEEFLLTLFKTATVTHEEHLPITLQPGTYRVGREREMDWFSKSVRAVID